MSALTYIASNHPLPIIHNPHERMVSVNEAIALGKTNIHDCLLAPDFDRDKPGVMLVSDREVVFNIDTGEIDDGALDDDFALLSAEGCDSIYTEKEYAVYLEWNYYTEGRAQRIIDYIKQMNADVEAWMDRHNLKNVDSFRGIVNKKEDIKVVERLQYLRRNYDLH